MDNTQMNRMQMIKNKIDSLPSGSHSPSNHYWCVTCKKFFVLDKPECPYMTGMCVNTPIAVENLHPESTEALEKFGLFYPKIPQRIFSRIINDDFSDAGKRMASAYMDFIREWKFDNYLHQPLQTIKSFIIIMSGCETAQRINEESITFVQMDAGKIWEKEKIRKILQGGLEYLRETLRFDRRLEIDFIDIFGEREVGKYYCAKCGMFFEFGIKRESVTCPIMAQKCMFDPQHIDKTSYSSDKLIKVYEVTPDIYKRLVRSVCQEKDISGILAGVLKEWNISDGLDRIKAAIS